MFWVPRKLNRAPNWLSFAPSPFRSIAYIFEVVGNKMALVTNFVSAPVTVVGSTSLGPASDASVVVPASEGGAAPSTAGEPASAPGTFDGAEFVSESQWSAA